MMQENVALADQPEQIALAVADGRRNHRRERLVVQLFLLDPAQQRQQVRYIQWTIDPVNV